MGKGNKNRSTKSKFDSTISLPTKNTGTRVIEKGSKTSVKTEARITTAEPVRGLMQKSSSQPTGAFYKDGTPVPRSRFSATYGQSKGPFQGNHEVPTVDYDYIVDRPDNRLPQVVYKVFLRFWFSRMYQEEKRGIVLPRRDPIIPQRMVAQYLNAVCSKLDIPRVLETPKLITLVYNQLLVIRSDPEFCQHMYVTFGPIGVPNGYVDVSKNFRKIIHRDVGWAALRVSAAGPWCRTGFNGVGHGVDQLNGLQGTVDGTDDLDAASALACTQARRSCTGLGYTSIVIPFRMILHPNELLHMKIVWGRWIKIKLNEFRTRLPVELQRVECAFIGGSSDMPVWRCTTTLGGISVSVVHSGRKNEAEFASLYDWFGRYTYGEVWDDPELVSQLNGANGEVTGLDDLDNRAPPAQGYNLNPHYMCTICNEFLAYGREEETAFPHLKRFNYGCACVTDVCVRCAIQSAIPRWDRGVNGPLNVGRFSCPTCRVECNCSVQFASRLMSVVEVNTVLGHINNSPAQHANRGHENTFRTQAAYLARVGNAALVQRGHAGAVYNVGAAAPSIPGTPYLVDPTVQPPPPIPNGAEYQPPVYVGSALRVMTRFRRREANRQAAAAQAPAGANAAAQGPGGANAAAGAPAAAQGGNAQPAGQPAPPDGGQNPAGPDQQQAAPAGAPAGGAVNPPAGGGGGQGNQAAPANAAGAIADAPPPAPPVRPEDINANGDRWDEVDNVTLYTLKNHITESLIYNFGIENHGYLMFYAFLMFVGYQWPYLLLTLLACVCNIYRHRWPYALLAVFMVGVYSSHSDENWEEVKALAVELYMCRHAYTLVLISEACVLTFYAYMIMDLLFIDFPFLNRGVIRLRKSSVVGFPLVYDKIKLLFGGTVRDVAGGQPRNNYAHYPPDEQFVGRVHVQIYKHLFDAAFNIRCASKDHSALLRYIQSDIASLTKNLSYPLDRVILLQTVTAVHQAVLTCRFHNSHFAVSKESAVQSVTW